MCEVTVFLQKDSITDSMPRSKSLCKGSRLIAELSKCLSGAAESIRHNYFPTIY